ncbi:hypothetical protein BB560_006977 [Smittium megazygosporum]|uniref:Mitochondrial import inner membrane translocase subunit TIM17 n=1 Tax=Smittium megazygosporum TaxID=133381 RepID=A0A2T9XZP6_9FUNG|nr:hypothetical protein BB560_006977 [Smittium megazygosporum]
MRGSDTTRDPCPWVILNDAGGAFCMGAIGGGGERFRGAVAAMRARGPVLGGNFGIWGGMFSTFDCAMRGIRQKEDPWNAIASGAITGGMLAIRGGWRTASVSAAFGGILLALIEGIGIGISRLSTGAQPPMAPLPPSPN